jgi:uncharacterized membrane protein YhaH (DUF805 family)
MIVQRPKTFFGVVLVLFITGLAIAVGAVFVPIVVALGPWMWGGLVLLAMVPVAIAVHMRRVEAARERAWVGAFSFGDVTARLRAKELLAASA